MIGDVFQVDFPSSLNRWELEATKVACVSWLFRGVFETSMEQALILGAVTIVGYKYLTGDSQLFEMVQAAYARVGGMIRPRSAEIVQEGSICSAVVRTEVDPENVLRVFQEAIYKNICCNEGGMTEVEAAREKAIRDLTSIQDGTLQHARECEDCIETIGVIFAQVQQGNAETVGRFLSANFSGCSLDSSLHLRDEPVYDPPFAERSVPSSDLSDQDLHPATCISTKKFSRSSLKRPVSKLFYSTNIIERFSSKKGDPNVQLFPCVEHGFTKRYAIKGDGNCYYRSVMFASMKRAIEEDRTLLIRMQNAMGAITSCLPKENQKKHENLLIYLQKIKDDSSFTVDQLLQDMNTFPSLDRTLVRAARYLLAYELSPRRIEAVIADLNRSHPQQQSAILSTTIAQLRERVSDYRSQMLKDGEWTDGEYVALQILPMALGWKEGISIMQGNGNIIASSSEEAESSRLLLHSVHYDVVSK